MPFQQGSSADHVFEKSSLEYFGLGLFLVGIGWIVFSLVDLLQLSDIAQYRISERGASLVVYTLLYIYTLSWVYSFRDMKVRRTRGQRGQADAACLVGPPGGLTGPSSPSP